MIQFKEKKLTISLLFLLELTGACEILGVIFGLLLILYTKRKWMFTGLFNIIGGLIAYSAWIVPIDSRFKFISLPLQIELFQYIKSLFCCCFLLSVDTNLRVALLMLSSMFAKTAISCTLAILTTCTTELVCSEKKKICGFSTIVYARMWLLCAPFIGATIVFGQLIPQTALSSLTIIGGILSTLISSPRTILPPVKHSNLPKEIYPEIYTIKNFDGITIGDKLKA